MNSSAAHTFYRHFALIISIMFALEAVLEYRHYLLGYDTPLFGTLSQQAPPADQSRPSKFGPTADFPFRSELLPPEKNGHLRLWIASASHAYGGRVPADKIFPNDICARLPSPTQCQSINGSDNGMSIAGNIRLLNQYAPIYQPDYAILYQMSMIISDQQKRLTQGEGGGSQTSNSIVDFSPAIRLFESLSLYVHLSDYIGNNIKLQGNLKERLPASMDQDFEDKILSFVSACRQLGIQPVLSTFAMSHDLTNIHLMSRTEITNFVKYQAYLSPNGWIKTVSHYNELIKKIGQQQGITVVDIGAALNGKPDYFIDYVHFNEAGHQIVARTIGAALTSILPKESGRDI